MAEIITGNRKDALLSNYIGKNISIHPFYKDINNSILLIDKKVENNTLLINDAIYTGLKRKNELNDFPEIANVKHEKLDANRINQIGMIMII